MYLKYLQIVNYKNLRNVRFEFSTGANTIIGENDAGKSNAMTALRILLDSDYYYNAKRLKESDFSMELSNWRGHWIIISAFFDNITADDKTREMCAELIPENEDEEFLKSYVRCEGYNYGTVTLFIRPDKKTRKLLYDSMGNPEEFNHIRNSIKLTDYDFIYTVRSQADFTDPVIYSQVVGDIENGNVSNPDNDDTSLIGININILDIWKHVSIVFIDALRDASDEMRKPKNPLRRIFDAIQSDIDQGSMDDIKGKIHALNAELASIPNVAGIGTQINKKLEDIVGLVYSPDINIESRLKEDVESIARYLAISPRGEQDIEQLGLGHLNILYIALKLVEFDANRNHEILNIMVIEEPEVHIHTHIQRTLFDKLQMNKDYTQVIMTTHSTHLSEVSKIRKMNLIKKEEQQHSLVMRPINGLDKFGNDFLQLHDISLAECLERYLDAKRSVLLFSKGVILVEGDAEEILIPSLVRNCLGVTLDELGIGLINIGSVAFEYIASIFSDDRLQCYCAILTDTDSPVDGACKLKPEAAKRGVSRKEKLEILFGENKWVSTFFAPHTLEIDFYDPEENRRYLTSIIDSHYTKKKTIESHKQEVNGSPATRYDLIQTLLSEIGKGWHSTILSGIVDENTIIPMYILDAIYFAAQEVLSPELKRKMIRNILTEGGNIELLTKTDQQGDNEAIELFRENYQGHSLAYFLTLGVEK